MKNTFELPPGSPPFAWPSTSALDLMVQMIEEYPNPEPQPLRHGALSSEKSFENNHSHNLASGLTRRATSL
jgi:hypothetical protein